MGIFKKRPKNFSLIDVPRELLPRHIGIIMDGNGRWAKKRGLPRSAGHIMGAKNFKTIASHANKIGISFMTAYAFSTENWKREQQEIENIMNLLADYLRDVSNYKHENIRLRFIGDRSVLRQDIQDLMAKAEQEGETATGMVLNLAINYGGRAELVSAVQKLAADVKLNCLTASQVSEDTISAYLQTAGQPDPDLIIRPSGEYRLSNFLTWQSAYSEFWFSNVLWPDFSKNDLELAIIDYLKRNRRFGS